MALIAANKFANAVKHCIFISFSGLFRLTRNTFFAFATLFFSRMDPRFSVKRKTTGRLCFFRQRSTTKMLSAHFSEQWTSSSSSVDLGMKKKRKKKFDLSAKLCLGEAGGGAHPESIINNGLIPAKVLAIFSHHNKWEKPKQKLFYGVQLRRGGLLSRVKSSADLANFQSKQN